MGRSVGLNGCSLLELVYYFASCRSQTFHNRLEITVVAGTLRPQDGLPFVRFDVPH